uniref:Uncharacterized protein n=1 Tax=uncultured Acetothermia bacterium TaxID=236499 RepID=H5SL08_9BACT|nr:hypothetical protein HGMM_F43B07C28 [uncultured Acetothermia bacterium]
MQDVPTEKVKLSVGDAINRVLEAMQPLDDRSRETVLLAVCHHLGIKFPVGEQQTAHLGGVGRSPQPTSVVEPEARSRIDIRTFAQEKAPASAIEQAVLVAYYLSELAPEGERKDFIEKQDLMKYFKQAHFYLPKRPEQTLIDARHAGYLDPVGEGRYRLNAVGHNLIAHNLPRQTTEQKRGSRRPQGKRKKRSRRASK